MERLNISKLFLLPALALGLIVAWAGYAGTETRIEDMSSAIGAGWSSRTCDCDNTITYENDCPKCDVDVYSVSGNSESTGTTWTYSDWCKEMNISCGTMSTAVCQDDEPNDPPDKPF